VPGTLRQIGVNWLAGRIEESTPRGIALAVAGLIHGGEVPPGARMPTVRDLAAGLSVHQATVARAWAILREDQLIGTGGRNGTVALVPRGAHRGFPGWETVDLEDGAPDPSLLPPLEDAIAAAAGTHRRDGSARDAITPDLLAAVAPTWPFAPEAWTVTAGGHEGSLLACRAVARPGEVVALEAPTAPRLVENLRKARARIVPVACDGEGPRPDALAEALTHRPAAFVYQPRAQVPCGHSVPPGRVEELAVVLARGGQGTVVVEEDDLGPLASTPPASIGAYLPSRVLLVRSYCHAYGVELRSCVVAGAARLVDRVRELRGSGLVWSSKTLQDAQAFLIGDQATETLLALARRRYARRREALAEALLAEGVEVVARDGLVLWVPVADETRALITLAASGVSVGAGSRCFADPPSRRRHLRVAVGQLPDDLARVADLAGLVAMAARDESG
jgi:DNA-binding transcriptional MocR family regulator